MNVTRIATIGARDDPVLLKLSSAPVMDSRRQVYAWSAEKAMIAVFDSTGRFERTIGSFGSGPGEFRYAVSPMFIGQNDTLYVVQPREIQVISPSHAYVRTIHFDGNILGEFLALRTGDFVASLSIPSRDLAGIALHILGPDGQRKKSLPDGDGVLDPRCYGCLARYLFAAPGRDAFWSLKHETLALTEYAYDGTRLRSLVIDGSRWLPDAATAAVRAGTLRLGPGVPRVSGGWVDTVSGYVWVIGSAPRNGRIGPAPNVRAGTPLIASDSLVLAWDDQKVTIIEVIDPDRHAVVASSRVDRSMLMARPGVLYSRRQTDEGIVKLDLWRVDLHQAQPYRRQP